MKFSRAISIFLLSAPAFAQDSVGTLAGRAQQNGAQDGTALEARFNDPAALACDNAGNIYVADSRNNVIRRITPTGVVTTIAISGPAFDTPSGLAVSAKGLIVSDTGNHVIRRINPDGSTVNLAGMPGQPGSEDGLGSLARFNNPLGLAISTNDTIYVADCGNHSIRAISSDGEVTTVAGTAGAWGSSDGIGANARFNGPIGIALDGGGNLFVSDSNNHTIRRITPVGEVTTWAGAPLENGYVDGDRRAARFFQPAELAFDSHGALYIADSMNHAIRKIPPGAKVSTVAGFANRPGSEDGANQRARFYNPYGIAFLPSGELAITDAYNQTIRNAAPPSELESQLSLDGGLILQWNAVIGKTYQVQTTSPTLDAWLDIGSSTTASNHFGAIIIRPVRGVAIFRLATSE